MLPSDGQSGLGETRPIRILLVDDQTLFSSLLREILTHQPRFLVVGEAATASAALATIETAAPDLVLVDLVLPDMSGLELIDRLLAGKPAYKIVVCSAACHDRAIAMAFGLGVHGFVEKTCGIPELIEALDRTAQGSISLSPRVSNVLRQQARADANVASLRPGELGILRRILRHESVRTIARDVGLSESGVYKVRQRIARRTGATTKRELYQVAVELGLLPEFPEEGGTTSPAAPGADSYKKSSK